jgi:hypothetical protein
MKGIDARTVILVVPFLVGLGMANQAASAAAISPLPDQPWEMGMGADPTVIGLFILGAAGVEIFRRLRRKGS